MGTKSEPSAFDCYTKAEPDEPMFILLARDPQAPDLVRQWARDRHFSAQGEEGQQVNEALLCAGAMDVWRAKNRPATGGHDS